MRFPTIRPTTFLSCTSRWWHVLPLTVWWKWRGFRRELTVAIGIWWFPDWIKPFMGKRYFGLWFDFEQPEANPKEPGQ